MISSRVARRPLQTKICRFLALRLRDGEVPREKKGSAAGSAVRIPCCVTVREDLMDAIWTHQGNHYDLDHARRIAG
jgi:hypothetical protein